MNELTPMKLNEDFLESPERFKVYEAEYNDFLFRIVFSPLVGLYTDVLNSEERCNIVQNKFKKFLELRDFNPVLILYYSPITEYNEEVISLRLGFRNIDGKEYADYTALFNDDNELKIDFDDDKKNEMCKLANLLYLINTEMTCYEAMLEDRSFDLLIEDYFDVRKLKRMSRQALDKFREIKMRIEAVCTHRNHHVNKALNKLMCRIIKTVMNYQN